jgi:hypothetical protein
VEHRRVLLDVADLLARLVEGNRAVSARVPTGDSAWALSQSAQYTSISYSERLLGAGALASIGSIGEDPAPRGRVRNGWIYEYEDVPAMVHAELMAAASPGGHLKRIVVDPQWQAVAPLLAAVRLNADATDLPARWEKHLRMLRLTPAPAGTD